MRERINLYTTDQSFDFGDFPNGTCYQEEHHGIEIDINDNKPDIKTLEGFGNFTYLTQKYTLETLANELKTHIEDVKLCAQEMGVIFINEKKIGELIKLLEKGK